MLTLGPDFPNFSSVLFITLFVLPLACGTLANRLLTSGGPQHFEKGLKYYTDSKFAEALTELNQAIAIDTQDSVSFHARGNVHYELHHYAEAVEDYNRAVALEPNDASAYGNRGWSYRHLGQEDLAVRDWQTCHRLLRLTAPLPETKTKPIDARSP